jgi:hypothetical protein
MKCWKASTAPFSLMGKQALGKHSPWKGMEGKQRYYY